MDENIPSFFQVLISLESVLGDCWMIYMDINKNI